MELTEIIISQNYFWFVESGWLQTNGTAMGTPMACVYFSIYFIWKEIFSLMVRFYVNLKNLDFFIESQIIVWKNGGGNTIDDYGTEIKNYGPKILKWILTKPGR